MALPDPETLATLSEEELARTLRIDTATLGALSRTIEQNPRSTIEPAMASSDAPGRLAIAGLDAEREHRGVAGGLSMEQTIGEGGMGIVRMATQRSLGRKVAVKTLRPGSRSERSTLHLLREAWVTGSLEHPNIVPVYDLGLDDEGSPIIVLKKIEGVAWEELIRDPAELARRFGATDPLEYHLRTLVQVCNAVSLAHARGVLHRDLKPENVMIGSFGEVYLVDWGIAVSLKEDPTGRMPHAKDVGKEVAGTPCYMAPEMLGAAYELSERTDVYLLGAVLSEILTGQPPHQGSFTQIVAAILLSTPTLGPDVPPELAAIVTRAMSRDPADRFASVDELRQRVEWYLRHRGSLALSAEASKRLAQARERSGDGPEAREEVYHLLAEARFGFRQALAASEDNEAARSGIAGAIETAVELELAHGTPGAAAAALAELDDPPAALAARVREAVLREAKKRAELEHLERQFDPSIGRRTRVFVTVVLGLTWTLAPLAGPKMERSGGDPHQKLLFWIALMLVVSFSVAHWARDSLGKTAVNRNLRATVMLTFAADLMMQLGSKLMGVPFATSVAYHFVAWFFSSALFSVLVERRTWPVPIAYLAGFLVTCLLPEWRWYAMSASHLSLVLATVLVWGELEEARPRAIAARIEERRRIRASQKPPPR